jgi:hypothetical protein
MEALGHRWAKRGRRALLTLQFAAIAGDVRAHDKKAAQLLAPDLHEIAAAAADKRK